MKTHLDAAFVEKQRQYLLRLRTTLLATVQAARSDEQDVIRESSGSPVEYEEDAQRLDTLERDDNLIVRETERLEHVDRALQKIAEGTYGLSDLSGQPIARQRLEAVPDALYTLSEEQQREGKR